MLRIVLAVLPIQHIRAVVVIFDRIKMVSALFGRSLCWLVAFSENSFSFVVGIWGVYFGKLVKVMMRVVVLELVSQSSTAFFNLSSEPVKVGHWIFFVELGQNGMLELI